MTPGLRTQRHHGHARRAAGLGLLLVLLTGGTTRTAYAAPSAHEAGPRPSPSASASRTASAAASPAPAADASRAGSRAGEGRERPGREEPDPREDDSGPTYTDRDPGSRKRPEHPDRPADGDDTERADATADADDPQDSGTADGDGTPESAVAPEPPQDAARQPGGPGLTRSAPEEPVLRILPLGSGLILIGCGLGLAFLALRTRRG